MDRRRLPGSERDKLGIMVSPRSWEKTVYFRLKQAVFTQKWPQNGAKFVLSFTDSLLGKKYILLIQCKLQEMKERKKRFPQGGGWGYAGF
jgi:hypothetical protein